LKDHSNYNNFILSKGQPLIYVTNVGKKTRCTKRKKNALPFDLTFFSITNNLCNKRNLTQQAISGKFGFLNHKGLPSFVFNQKYLVKTLVWC
jgi:hypothetical protein